MAHDDENVVLTVDEVAVFLRTEPSSVTELLESGRLAGFKVTEEWRVLRPAVEDFLRRGMEAAELEALARTISDPRAWAREIRRNPEWENWLREQSFEDATFGAWLTDALKVEEAEGAAGNVVPLDRPRRG